ncbi:MAG TPA: UdgX family uracil-DNA binding protein [Xanthobacteraceae bacterium]
MLDGSGIGEATRNMGPSSMEAAEITSLRKLRDAEAQCTRCPLYRNATQVVPGEGPTSAALMLVGEQPGTDEDIAGKPFVGPAGRMLDRALADAGLDRNKVFVTNAVKHFKFELRGKRRLHKRPNAYEIERCRWWNDLERAIVKPELVVALGATAARSLLGRTVSITSVRGKILQAGDGMRLAVTIHPSYLLRIIERQDNEQEYRRFVGDLRMCKQALRDAA